MSANLNQKKEIQTLLGLPKSLYYSNLAEQVLCIEAELQIDKTSLVLDIGAGNGNIANGLTSISKCQILAVDTDKSPKLNSHICWIQTDFLQKIPVLRELDAAYWVAPYIGDGWFDGSFERLIKEFGMNIKPGGRFLIDLFNFAHKEIGKQKEIIEPHMGGRAWYKRTSIDKYEGRRIFDNGSQDHVLIWRIFEQSELIDIFKEAGFKLVHKLDSFGSNLSSETQRVIDYKKYKRDIYIFEKFNKA